VAATAASSGAVADLQPDSTLRRLAAFAAGLTTEAVPADLLGLVRLHVLDCVGAALAGADVAETRAAAEMGTALSGAGTALAVGPGLRFGLPAAVLVGTVSARCSELDDIHLAACVTPGSVVVPTALAVASWRAGAADDDAFLAACLAGYEVLIRWGLAVDGAHLLYRGTWPTALCAAFGAAATTGRLLGFDTERMAHTLAMAATLDAPGDPGTGYGWEAVEAKLTAMLGGRAHGLRSVCERLGQGALPELLDSLSAPER
jgi:2-methylcitrate dehydratase PrpD